MADLSSAHDLGQHFDQSFQAVQKAQCIWRLETKTHEALPLPTAQVDNFPVTRAAQELMAVQQSLLAARQLEVAQVIKCLQASCNGARKVYRCRCIFQLISTGSVSAKLVCWCEVKLYVVIMLRLYAMEYSSNSSRPSMLMTHHGMQGILNFLSTIELGTAICLATRGMKILMTQALSSICLRIHPSMYRCTLPQELEALIAAPALNIAPANRMSISSKSNGLLSAIPCRPTLCHRGRNSLKLGLGA